MINLGQTLRLLAIQRVMIRHGLDEIIFATHLFRPIRFVRYVMPWNWFPRLREPYPVRIRRMLEDLGPIFIKFGQILSTRRDLLPPDLAEELVKLQDRVPPFPGAEARRLIEAAIGQPIAAVFADFDDRPLASASIAQVHPARLMDGREVVVKVLRPGIALTIRRDVDLLYTLARLAQRHWKEARRLRPVEVVEEYERTIFDELDLSREAANASQLRRNFPDSEIFYVPEVHWDWTRKTVMVMERIYGISMGDIPAIKAQGVSMKTLGERGVEIFFTQVFRDNFFHADMHPGNIFVSPEGRYIAVDFGIMGTLTTEDQRYLAENLLAFFHRDYRRVAELHVESGWVPAGTRVDEFEAAIRTVSEPIFEKPLAEISFGHFLLHLFQTARRFDMVIQPQLVLLQKTLLNIEGLGRQLYPELDLWSTAKPFMERWMANQVGPRAFFRRLRDTLPYLSEQLPEMPQITYRILKNLDEGTGSAALHRQELTALRQELRRNNRNTLTAIMAGSLLIAGTLLLLFGQRYDALPPLVIEGAAGTLLLLAGVQWLRLWRGDQR